MAAPGRDGQLMVCLGAGLAGLLACACGGSDGGRDPSPAFTVSPSPGAASATEPSTG